MFRKEAGKNWFVNIVFEWNKLSQHNQWPQMEARLVQEWVEETVSNSPSGVASYRMSYLMQSLYVYVNPSP